MDQYHVLNLTDPRTRKRHVIAFDGQWYLDGAPIIFDELLNEVLAIVTLEEEQEEMSTRKTRDVDFAKRLLLAIERLEQKAEQR